MTGFSADWLAMREPIDHRSINADLRARFAQAFSDHETINITDLGSGSGSSLRALCPFLPLHQTWRLCDHDPALLDHARKQLSSWADKAEYSDGVLHLTHAEKNLEIHLVQADLAGGVSAKLLDGVDLVTSSAFFDLVSLDWIAAFARTLAARRLPLYGLLTYDGTEIWKPPHPFDTAMLEAFHKDQHRDKGFGPAAGPDAASALEQSLAGQSYDVIRCESPWRLAADDRDLISALANGSAAAIAAAGTLSAGDIESWRRARSAATDCTIGHDDILALPR